MKTYYFEDLATGEEFFVEEWDAGRAQMVAEEFFEEPKLIRQVSLTFAELLGLDTY